jgi:hypothetical protein
MWSTIIRSVTFSATEIAYVHPSTDSGRVAILAIRPRMASGFVIDRLFKLSRSNHLLATCQPKLALPS